ncbi:N-acetylmuramoyl-L-alanine amidase [Nonomuraea jiangxiensis]|uniref:N-acetylmuramoyl-L-alanine amidase n=1 Tax=Nonomuraea jiangxiensis TaxID=633440 RepID=A0A1G8DCM5_9ACTN|nr:N-acetylmuramoyl-L-alanine amidase [Nonomuraea jiangxiensis]SDH55482.1 N-acetylmuramoyl-L-alanine amidase [Nonomuraea jiangxiensis]
MQHWLAVVLTAGTLTAPAGATQAVAPGRQAERPATGRQADFAAAAREYGVPESVLLGVSYLESRWDANAGQPSTAGGYGPMHLVDAFQAGALSAGLVAGEASGEVIADALGDARGDAARPMRHQYADRSPTSALRMSQPPPPRTTLPEAGRLIGVDPARLRQDPAQNIRAGAALLASYQKRPSADPADWYGAVARYSGAEDAQAARDFADEVFSVMRQGMERLTDDGHLVRLRPVTGLPAPGAARQATTTGKAATPDTATTPDDAATGRAAAAQEGAATGSQAGTQSATGGQTGAGTQAATGREAGTGGRAGADGRVGADERVLDEAGAGVAERATAGARTEAAQRAGASARTEAAERAGGGAHAEVAERAGGGGRPDPEGRPVPDELFGADLPLANGAEIDTDDQADLYGPPRSRWKPKAKKRRLPGYGQTAGPRANGYAPDGELYGADGWETGDDPGPSGYPDTFGYPDTSGYPRDSGYPAPYGYPEDPGEFSALGAAESPDRSSSGDRTECPSSLTCEWMPAAHKRFGKKKDRDYGNHDRMSRARSVDYIVIHDTEGTYQGIPSMIRNPRYVSWHYTIRSRDGHVAQHVPTGHIAWHAGNWDVNTRSIGIEHEGYLAKGGTWYTEAMYRASAKLVKYLADKYDIPLNRAHILGHDNVPGTTPEMVAGMHEDPGPYWDWAHYFALMGKPFKPAKNGDSIIIRPSYNDHHPRFTGCVTTKPSQACPRHGAATVWLHKEPSEDSPLITDVGKHGDKPGTYSVYDHGARASTGQRYAVAGTEGDWTAIWYLGQKAWFHNPPANPTAIPARGPVVTPLTSKVRVYGRAYPERSAYKSASYQPLTPLQYRIAPGQEYTVGDTITGSYYSAHALDPSRHVTTTGTVRYYQIQLGHRVMFVMAKDVRLIR